MIRGDPYPDCQRSYLGETMPFPSMPKDLNYIGREMIENIEYDYWMQDIGTNRIHVYMTLDHFPFRVTNEQVLESESVPLMTYDWKKLKVVNTQTAESQFDSSNFEIPSPYHWRSCSRYIGGFPYLHLFHTFFRF
mmetsp:Transcript_24826/g.32332  ORF Transcript_24826/g.32332 Transcript_24826/m.32332 type:complete len:135 (-) Transcript_24826:55-459(-)